MYATIVYYFVKKVSTACNNNIYINTYMGGRAQGLETRRAPFVVVEYYGGGPGGPDGGRRILVLCDDAGMR